MRAAVFRGPGIPIEVESVDLAAPRAGEVSVRIAAAGVCRSDLHVRDGDWPLPLPMVLGHEGSGTVVETGPGVTDLEVGDHVVLSWVAPCGACVPCRRGHPCSAWSPRGRCRGRAGDPVGRGAGQLRPRGAGRPGAADHRIQLRRYRPGRRRPLEEAAASLADLATGGTSRELLIP